MIITKNYKDNQFEHWKGTSTPILAFNYLAFLSKYQQPSKYDNLDTNASEFDRVAISSSNISYADDIFTIEVTLSTSEVVCPTSIITAQTGSVITLTSSTHSAFKLDDLIEIPTSLGYKECRIIAKNNTTYEITIDTPYTATIGGQARIKVSTIAILCNATGTPAPSTDLVYCFIKNSFYKDSTATKDLTLKLNFIG
jgi:hypothetical protein